MELQHADHEALLGKPLEEPHAPAPVPAASGPVHRVEFKDRPFAVAFGLNAAVVVAIAVLLGLPRLFNIYFTIHGGAAPSPSPSPVTPTPAPTMPVPSHGLRMLWIFLLTSIVGGGISTLWLYLLQRHASEMINLTMRGGIVALTVAAAIGFLDSGYGGRAVGFANLVLAGVVLLYYLSIRHSIAFAASNLAAASRILCEFPNLVSSAYMALAAQGVWTLVWSTAVIGVLAQSLVQYHDLTSSGNVCFFFMLLSLCWFIEVLKNVVHCITAGAVGEWWFGLHDPTTVQRAKIRTLTISFGSVCLGSLVLAVLSALKLMLLSTPRRKGRRRGPNACLECILSFVTRNMQYFNKYAFCQVAIYGKDFQTAGYDTMRVFRARGWSNLINDTLVSSVLGVGAMVVGAMSGAVGSALVFVTMECTVEEAKIHPDQCETFNVTVLTFAACSIIGYAMCAIVSTILESIVATIFVCFAEDPAALQQTHPEEHNRLVDGWRRLKPELLAFAATTAHHGV